MVIDYLNSPEVESYCSASGVQKPVLEDDDQVITEENYLNEEASKIAKREYTSMLKSHDSHLSIENLEELVCQIQGIDSIHSLTAPKRGRRKKVVPVVQLEITEPATTTVAVAPPASLDSDGEEIVAEATKLPQPATTAVASKPNVPKKPKTRATLRDQFILVQNTPSRVIDVSNYGDTMQHQRGKMLDRVKHSERISKCTVLGDLFPVISDNVAGFERAMSSLGARFSNRVTEFKMLHASK